VHFWDTRDSETLDTGISEGIRDKRTFGKNLRTLRSLAGRYLALSAVCRLPGRSSMRLLVLPVFAPRGSFAGSLEDLSGPLRLPSENLSAAWGG